MFNITQLYNESLDQLLEHMEEETFALGFRQIVNFKLSADPSLRSEGLAAAQKQMATYVAAIDAQLFGAMQIRSGAKAPRIVAHQLKDGYITFHMLVNMVGAESWAEGELALYEVLHNLGNGDRVTSDYILAWEEFNADIRKEGIELDLALSHKFL